MGKKIRHLMMAIMGSLVINICIWYIGGLISLSTVGYATEKITIREISLKVIYSDTKEPVRNCPVYYIVRSGYEEKIWGFIPTPERNVADKYQIFDQKNTDDNGEVLFEKKQISLKSSEWILDERIFINLDCNEGKYSVCFKCVNKDEMQKKYKNNAKLVCMSDYTFGLFDDYHSDDHFANPIKNYKGFFIRSTLWKLNDKELPTKEKLANFLWNGESLKKEREELLIELELKKDDSYCPACPK